MPVVPAVHGLPSQFVRFAAVGVSGTGAGQLAELAVLIVAGGVAGAVGFVLMRRWVFGAPRPREAD